MIVTNSARAAITQATSNGRETPADMIPGPGMTDSLPQVLHSLDCGRVLAAIGRCERQVQDWLLAAYAADGYPGRVQAMIRCQATLYAEYTRRRAVRSSPDAALKLAGAVMIDHAAVGIGNESRSPAWYAQEVGFKAPNWVNWKRSRDAMADIVDEWDRRGLGEVAMVLMREAA